MLGLAWLLTTFLAGACAEAPVCLVEVDAIGLEPADTEALEHAAHDALRAAGAAPCPEDRATLAAAIPEACRSDPACLQRALEQGALEQRGLGGVLSLRFVRFGPTLEVASELLLKNRAGEPLRGRVRTSLEGFLERPRLGDEVEAALVCPAASAIAEGRVAEAPIAEPPIAEGPIAEGPLMEGPAAIVPAAPASAISSLLLPGGLTVAGVGLVLAGGGSAAALAFAPVLEDPTSAGPDKERALAIGATGLVGAGVGALLLTAGGGLALYGLLAEPPEKASPRAGSPQAASPQAASSPRNASTSRP